jgi:uncharacterized protein YndB with AHSA1/START domain
MKLPPALPHVLDREVLIRAPRALVFEFFRDPQRFADWWGAGSSIEGRVGGALRIAYPGGTVAAGQVLEYEPPARVVFSYGYEGPGQPIAPGASRVTVELRDDPHGTLLHLRHEFADATVRDHHVQGWRYHLAVFAVVATRQALAAAVAGLPRWFAAWSEDDEQARARLFGELVTEDVTFGDDYSATSGRADLLAHVTGARQHMRGLRFEARGNARHCQGTALLDWEARTPDGQVRFAGTNLFELDPSGRIARVVGLWSPPPAP